MTTATYYVNLRSQVVHHVLCTQTKRSPLLQPWDRRLPDDRPCNVCLPDGLPEAVSQA